MLGKNDKQQFTKPIYIDGIGFPDLHEISLFYILTNYSHFDQGY